MYIVNTRIMRPLWRKVFEKRKTYRNFGSKNVKNRVFFRAKRKKSGIAETCSFSIRKFWGVIDKNRLRNKKVYAFTNMVVLVSASPNVNTHIIFTQWQASHLPCLFLSARGFFVSWWGSLKVGRPCQGVRIVILQSDGLLLPFCYGK